MKQLLTFFILVGGIFYGVQSHAQIHIPDTNFANAIRNQCATCIDANNDLLPDASTLTDLDVYAQNITTLQGVDGFTSLSSLFCDSNQLTSIAVLPSNLTIFTCNDNQLTSLPTLPNSLQALVCTGNVLASLPALPNGLLRLFCDNNQLTSLPALPNSLQRLSCFENALTSLPTLPNSLEALWCGSNPLINLPNLPNSINSLICNNNQLSVLPTLPSSLEFFSCGSNYLTSFPAFPNTLAHLSYAYNQISNLTAPLPNNLLSLDCSNNGVTTLPALPSRLRELYCMGNPKIMCLPQLPDSLTFLNVAGTRVNCLPNIPIGIAAANTLSACSPINRNHCPTFTQLVGSVYIDFNANCLNEATDSNYISSVLLQAASTTDTFYTYTSAFGQYAFTLPVGQYEISVYPVPSFFYTACSYPAVTISSPSSFVNQDLGIQPAIICPFLEVDIDADILRRCQSSYYRVHYRNTGADLATNAYIDITFDNFLSYISNTSSITPTHLGNNVYRFLLGNLGIGQQGDFSILVNVSCGALLGQVHCTEAHIYPDSICGLNWTGANIQLQDSCLGDSAVFRLANRGGSMAFPQTYHIIEDNLMYRPSTPFLLNNNQFLDVVIPIAPSKIYRIEVAQAASFPPILGNPTAWGLIRNCNGISHTTPNFVNQYYTDNTASSIADDCSANRSSFDPNEKSAQPIGYGNQHLIPANTPLKYRIDFQNTGTDTAFRVAILDTLDAAVLDIATLHMGTSSHNFTWTLIENHILQIVFDNILLADSFSNEPASHGFVSFTISQQPSLPNGTVINNSSAIYFDANDAVLTNTCFHTIGENFIVVANREILVPNVLVKVYPNPFQYYTLFEVSGIDYQQLTLKLTDVLGNEIKTIRGNHSSLQLERQQLPSATYFYQLYADEVLVNTGKIIAQ